MGDFAAGFFGDAAFAVGGLCVEFGVVIAVGSTRSALLRGRPRPVFLAAGFSLGGGRG